MNRHFWNRGGDRRSHNLDPDNCGSDRLDRDFLTAMIWLCACLLANDAQAARADNTTVPLGTVVVTDTGAPVALQALPGNTALVNGQALELIGETHPAQIF